MDGDHRLLAETSLGRSSRRCDIMRNLIRALWVILSLAAFLAVPATASDFEDGSGTPLVIQEGTSAQAPDLAGILAIPEPQWMTGTVDCTSCGVGTSSPGYLCMQECRSMGYFVNNCEADATTCQLIACNCMYD